VSDLTNAIRDAREAITRLEIALVDSEPAPHSIVLVEDASTGRIHRRARIEDIPGLMSYEADNADQAGEYRVIPDLSRVSDEALLCVRCFGPVDDAVETMETRHG